MSEVNFCVFCGSRSGTDPQYLTAARETGAELARRGLGLVYGGARIGLMGAVADGALDAGGRVIGVIPQAIADIEIAHEGLTALYRVDSMHERKALMAEHAAGFIALPGGLGTLEELFEVWTWAQLAIHNKPMGVLNLAGFYDPLLAFVDHQVAQGFVRPAHRDLLIAEDRAASLVEALLAFQPQTCSLRDKLEP